MPPLGDVWCFNLKMAALGTGFKFAARTPLGTPIVPGRAQLYERDSLMLTSNFNRGRWDQKLRRRKFAKCVCVLLMWKVFLKSILCIHKCYSEKIRLYALVNVKVRACV